MKTTAQAKTVSQPSLRSLSRYRVLKDEALTVLLPMRQPAANAAEYLMHRKTDLGGVHDYVDKKLRPRAATTDSLSLADQMFGFVIDKATGPGSAYAGHVRSQDIKSRAVRLPGTVGSDPRRTS